MGTLLFCIWTKKKLKNYLKGTHGLPFRLKKHYKNNAVRFTYVLVAGTTCWVIFHLWYLLIMKVGCEAVQKRTLFLDCCTLALKIYAYLVTPFRMWSQSFCGNFRTWIRLRRLAGGSAEPGCIELIHWFFTRVNQYFNKGCLRKYF